MTTFKDFGLNADIQASLDALGFTKPTPIQEKTIPFIINSRQDLIALAQTGTGKTAAFALPIIQQIKPGTRDLQAIILCPTRELCLQITKDIETFIKHSKKISVTPVFGGAPITTQIRALKQGTNIVVGTPGRVHDLIRRNVLKLGQIKWLVLDEADEMLDMGFKDDLDAVLAETPSDKQTLLFSATMSKSVYSIAQKYMKNAEEISVAKKNIGADKISHEYYVVQARDRYEALRRIVDMNPDIYGILFCRTRRETQEVADKLQHDHYQTEALHGEISQGMRTQIMDKFRKKEIQLLVATDVAARGIDVSDLTHVINYNLPDANETYTHRSGRTGRADKSGTSITIVHSREMRRIRELEQKIGKEFTQKQVPVGREICQVQLFHLIDKLKNLKINEKQIQEFLPAIEEKLKDLDRDELLKRLVLAEFNHFLGLYENAPDLNGFVRPERTRSDDSNFVNIRINLGKKDRIDVKTIFGLINKQPKLKGAEIGKIDIQDTFTVFGIDKNLANIIESAFAGENYRGRAIEVRPFHGAIRSGRPGGNRFSGKRPSRGRSFSGRPSGDRSGGGFRSRDGRDAKKGKKFGGEKRKRK